MNGRNVMENATREGQLWEKRSDGRQTDNAWATHGLKMMVGEGERSGRRERERARGWDRFRANK